MKPTNDIKAFYCDAGIDTDPAADAEVLMDAIEAGGLVRQEHPARTEPGMWRFLMQSRIARLAAVALIVVGAIVGVHHFNGTVVQAVEFSEIIKAMEEVPWMHASAVGFERGITGVAEQWIGFRSKIHAGRWADGKASFWNLREHQRAEYDPNSNTITLTYVGDDEFPLNMSSPALLLESMHKMFEDQGATVVARMGDYEGHRAQVQEISLRNVGRDGAENHKLTLYIDPDVKLLYAAEVAGLDANGNAVIAGGITFDYPREGPQDIYDLGVPRDAHIVDTTPPDEFRTVWERYGRIRAEATERYVAVIAHHDHSDDDVVDTVDVEYKSGRKRRRERHFVFHTGEAIREFWPKYRRQLGETFESLFGWTQNHHDDDRADISIYLYDGEYYCSTSRDGQDGWGMRENDYSPDYEPGLLMGLTHLAWPNILSTARIIEDDYAGQNGLICVESHGQGTVHNGWPSLPSRWLRYLDASRDYMCVRQVTESCRDAEWQEDKDWLVGVDPNKVRQDSTTMREITEAFQAPNGHWYPRVVIEKKCSDTREDYRDAPMKVTGVKTIYLDVSPTFPEGIFDIDKLPGQ